MSTTQELVIQANEANKSAGKAVKDKLYLNAMEMYSRAIELVPTNPVYYSNRSLCHEKLENYGLAIADASRAIELDPNYFKAYFRRATAQISIGHLSLALKDLKLLLDKFPKEKSVIDLYTECLNSYREHMLSKALEYEEKSPIDLIDFDSLGLLSYIHNIKLSLIKQYLN
ncbi:Serine/threonine-protein phosphatase 5 [Thelohanellus kitauei]|uniref:Serine/threonine-protein phosphatase 5 n=1 Tax=Thelohanellus kitauei TaxID=669202 RepID=A0A0C2NGD3_THEKT|nr:Serine/threonine-protein phosphatase 5 [Thelohanellus kitauei]